jgi:hypothetical protein
MKSRRLRIYSVDGSRTRVSSDEIMNSTGRVTAGLPWQLAALALRAEIGRTGTYLLVGPDPDSTTGDLIYIGELANVPIRLTKHPRTRRKRSGPGRSSSQQGQEFG